MNNNVGIIKGYLIPAMLQAVIACIIKAILNINGVATGYSSVVGFVLIALIGISTAQWGIIYQVKHKGDHLSTIIRDFFGLKQPIRSYALVFIFLFIMFFDVIVSGGFVGINIAALLVLFAKALLFGGIEEIGWRYTFQPDVEKRTSFALSVLITSGFWSVWHILFFYVDGSISSLSPIAFIASLLSISFVLSALYKVTNSLWLCAMTHALINAFSQLATAGNATISYITKLLCIALALLLVYMLSKKRA